MREIVPFLETFNTTISMRLSPSEADVPLARAGLFAPNCDHHLNLSVSNFYDVRITNGSTEISMNDVLWNWVNGTQPTAQVTLNLCCTTNDSTVK